MDAVFLTTLNTVTITNIILHLHRIQQTADFNFVGEGWEAEFEQAGRKNYQGH